jgi:ABC-type phosphate/phosphonate transport system ATPase subunit
LAARLRAHSHVTIVTHSFAGRGALLANVCAECRQPRVEVRATNEEIRRHAAEVRTIVEQPNVLGRMATLFKAVLVGFQAHLAAVLTILDALTSRISWAGHDASTCIEPDYRAER